MSRKDATEFLGIFLYGFCQYAREIISGFENCLRAIGSVFPTGRVDVGHFLQVDSRACPFRVLAYRSPDRAIENFTNEDAHLVTILRSRGDTGRGNGAEVERIEFRPVLGIIKDVTRKHV